MIQPFTYTRDMRDRYGEDTPWIPHFLRRADEPIPKGGFYYGGICPEGMPEEVKTSPAGRYDRGKPGLVELTKEQKTALKAATRASGKQLKDVAAHLGIVYQTLTCSLNAGRYTKASTLRKWCAFIGVDPKGFMPDGIPDVVECAPPPRERLHADLVLSARDDIADELRRRKMTYAAFAEAIGERHETVMAFMKKKKIARMPHGRLEKICAVLGLDAETLIKKENK